MSEDTRRVLDMLAQGKITAEEADKLLAAMSSASTGSPAAGTAAAGNRATAGDGAQPKYLRITVTRTRGGAGNDQEHARRAWMWPGYAGGRDREVTIRVPAALVRNGMRLGAMIPGLTGAGLHARLRERGVDMDFSRIDADTIDKLVDEFGELNFDIESGHGGKSQVRITSE